MKILFTLLGLNRAGSIEARDVAMMTYLEAHGAREKP
jgi:hypothetical protein